ncbi:MULTISPECIES: GNAT family N-acetyltransferase [Bacillus]|uniref:GNAT family N-acetyltransferase n=1 Tax=Bacillus TaxID=1386 RepID=UPI000DC1D690|nr:GNAT family N-acetyltransferase [Bacillus subtilis]AWX21317.1 GNAT family N-acetyltransferase [Bacillus subtilis subsp. subtilis]MEC1877431.1 GNAT family N-acetyltransferase [Bacillus subtilis]MEC1939200.1 GNAT family N-acetyltransferase [Bacillus subtilis]
MSAFKIENETIADGFYACPAVYEDAESITGLLVRTAEWLRDRGSNQWSGLLKGQDIHDITGSIEKGHVFVFKKDDELAAVVMLLPAPSEWDRTLWGDDGHEESIYLHRLAVSRRFAGQGLGARVLQWAETGIHFPGKTRIRLDCVADSDALHSFYRRMGYEFMGADASGYHLFEKEITAE